IIHGYAPTLEQKEIDILYDDTQVSIRRENNMFWDLTGDSNGKIGAKGEDEPPNIGKFG
ncbi:hypothetical protein HHI36_000727, partial [Cryptolaemus montrouzieri]